MREFLEDWLPRLLQLLDQIPPFQLLLLVTPLYSCFIAAVLWCVYQAMTRLFPSIIKGNSQ